MGSTPKSARELITGGLAILLGRRAEHRHRQALRSRSATSWADLAGVVGLVRAAAVAKAVWGRESRVRKRGSIGRVDPRGSWDRRGAQPLPR